MTLGNICEACGRRNPVFATGPGPGVSPVHNWEAPVGVKPFLYIRSKLCMSCRHAPTLPGKLAPKQVRTVG